VIPMTISVRDSQVVLAVAKRMALLPSVNVSLCMLCFSPKVNCYGSGG